MFKRAFLALVLVIGGVFIASTSYATGTGSISGVVTDESGNPVEGVRVILDSSGDIYNDSSGAYTDSSGAYQFDAVAESSHCLIFLPPVTRPELVPMRYVTEGALAFAYSDSHGTCGGVVSVIADGVSVANQVLPLGGTVSGSITRADGTPIAGATVFAILPPSFPFGQVQMKYTVTGADGVYTLGGLSPFGLVLGGEQPRSYTLSVVTPDNRSGTLGPFQIYPGTVIIGADIIFPDPITGTAQLYLGGVPYTAGLFQGPGLCLAPVVFGVGSSFCGPGQSFGPGIRQLDGSFVVGPLSPGTYTARAVTVFGGLQGPHTTFTVDVGDTFHCDLPYDAAATCTVTPIGPPPPNDDDGVPAGVEDASPNSGDGNGDGTLDSSQDNVASTTDPTGGYVTAAAPAGQSVFNVSVVSPASLPSPPVGVNPETGIIGFSLNVAAGTTTTVSLYVDDPSGSVNSFWKYQGGVWINASSLATFTVLGDGRTKVVVTLTDGGAGDADGAINGVIVDPGMAAHYTPYVFTGFRPPVDNAPTINVTKAGSTIPVKWRLTNADGTPVATPASFVSVRLLPGSCSASALVDPIEVLTTGSGLKYLGSGEWQFNWKSDQAWRGCGLMELKLADGTTHQARFQFR